jgi:putative ABC transport system ATP-binding protein
MKNHGSVISVSALFKTYEIDNTKIKVLQEVQLEVEKGELVAIEGPSGSGKTTLLNIISGIDKPSSGRVTVFDESIEDKDEDFLASFRCNNVGFVFQAYNLVSTLTVAENVAFPMEWIRKSADHIRTRVQELLKTVNLQHRAEHFPTQLSGGEQQRVAFARALANDPPLLLADEPTGNLDAATSVKIIEILRSLKDDGKTVAVATHDGGIFQLADKRFDLRGGKLVNLDE